MPDQPAVRRHPTATLTVLSLGVVAYALSQTMIAPALPAIQQALGISTSAVAWSMTAYLIAASVMTAVLGRLGDMFGKKRVLVATLVAFGIGSAICAVAGSIELLVAGRVVQGAAGGLFPLAYGIVRDELPRERVPGGIGLISSIIGVGGGLGLVFGGLLVDHVSWHWIFWLALLLTVLSVAMTAVVVPESPIRTPGRIDWGGALLLTVGLSAPLVAVSQGAVWGWLDRRTVGLAIAGTLLLALFAWFERRQAEPLVDMATFTAKPVILTNVATLFVGVAMFAGFVLVPQLVQLPRSTGVGFGATATVAGLLMLPSTVATLLAASLSGRIGARRGSKGPLVAGAAITSVAFFLFAVSHGNPVVLIVWGTVQGVGIGLAFAAMPNLIIEVVPQRQTGEATAVNALLRNVGAAIGSQIAGTVLASHVLLSTGAPSDRGFSLAFAIAAVSALIAGAVAGAIPRLRRGGDGSRSWRPPQPRRRRLAPAEA